MEFRLLYDTLFVSGGSLRRFVFMEHCSISAISVLSCSTIGLIHGLTSR